VEGREIGERVYRWQANSLEKERGSITGADKQAGGVSKGDMSSCWEALRMQVKCVFHC
jgi:hypothetical protein